MEEHKVEEEEIATEEKTVEDKQNAEEEEDDEHKDIKKPEVSFKSISVAMGKDISETSEKSASDLDLTDEADYDMFRKIVLASKNAQKPLFDVQENNDDVDLVSRDPSYANFQIPYVVKCRMRYAQKSREYDKQFKKEMEMLEIYQQNPYEAARFSRHLALTTLWPPLHNRREVDKFLRNYFVHTPKNRKRLYNLLNEPQT